MKIKGKLASFKNILKLFFKINISEASTNGAGTTTGPNSEIVNLVLRKEISKDILDIDASENGDDLQT